MWGVNVMANGMTSKVRLIFFDLFLQLLFLNFLLKFVEFIELAAQKRYICCQFLMFLGKKEIRKLEWIAKSRSTFAAFAERRVVLFRFSKCFSLVEEILWWWMQAHNSSMKSLKLWQRSKRNFENLNLTRLRSQIPFWVAKEASSKEFFTLSRSEDQSRRLCRDVCISNRYSFCSDRPKWWEGISASKEIWESTIRS